MTKKKLIAIGSAVLVLALSVSTVLFFRANNLASPVDDTPIAPVTEEKEEVSVPEIIKPVESVKTSTEEFTPPPKVEVRTEGDEEIQTPNWAEQKVLKEGTDLTDHTKVPEYKTETKTTTTTPSTTPVKEPEKPVTSTPETAPPVISTPDTPVKEPEKPVTSTPETSVVPPIKPTNPPKDSEIPAQRDEPLYKEIDGVKHVYIDGFGWVPYSGPSTSEIVEGGLSGNQVGH